jgi:hypothetical protein
MAMALMRSWLAACVAVLAASGCATYHTSTLIWPSVAEHKGEAMDHVYEVTAAYRDPAGNVLICARGMPAGRPYWQGEGEFSLLVTNGLFAGDSAKPHLRRGTWGLFQEYAPPADDVRSSCPAAHRGSYAALPVEKVKAERFGSEVLGDMSIEKVREFFRMQAIGPAVYVIVGKHWRGTTVETPVIFYVHDSIIAGDSRAVQIRTGFRKVESQPAWLVALPFAAAIDLVTLPIQIVVALVMR